MEQSPTTTIWKHQHGPLSQHLQCDESLVVGVAYLCVVKLQMGEFEVLKHLDVCVPDQEVSVLLGPALLQRPVLTTLDTATLHHPWDTKNSTYWASDHVTVWTTFTVHKHLLLVSITQLTAHISGEGASPGGHDDDKYHLLPHHAPEVNKGFL